MKRENNKKFKKRKRNQKRSLTCRVLSMMFAIVLLCSTVLINTDYVSQASSFDDMVDMVEVEEDSAAVDTSEETGDDLDTDVNFESEEGSAETYSESDDFGSSDADFSSGENMFTDGTSESSTPTEEAAQPVSCIVNLKNETIEIKAEAPAGVLPNGTQMTVKAVENNTEDAEMTDQYNKLAAKITEQLQSQGKNLDGFLAYNVSFTDADGNPVEPAGKVNYSFTYKEASSPELTDPAASTVTAAMIRTNKETSELELTELKAEEDQLTVETNESRQLTKAAFQSAATAAYTFVWSSTPAADDNENTENKEENGEVNNEEVNADTNTENTEENGEETNTENNVENSEEEQNPEEAPDQEQIKMIRITADEVNLRVAPSTEAEVIATVDTDTQLPLLETVTAEDESTWYKVSYEETEAYVRSDVAEVVETEEQGTENEDPNEEEADVQVEDEVTYSKTIGNVVVTATAAKNVLPDNAEFVVTPIVQETDPDKYAETETKLNEKAGEDGYEIAGFLAYDIYFQDSEGNKIEPVDGSVNVSMHYTEPSVPEEVAQVTENGSEAAVFTEEDEFSQNETTATQMDVTMMHLVEDENGNVNVVDMTQEGTANVETDAAGSVKKAEFETESFSIFTITWNVSTGKILTVHLVDTNLKDIPSSVTANESVQSDRANIEVSILGTKYLPEGYTYTRALANDKVTEISAISYNSNSKNTRGWFYENKGSWKHATTADNYDIYLVYNKTAKSVTIKDDIIKDGNLVIETDEATTTKINNAIAENKEVTYTWLKSTDGGANYTPVNKVKHGDKYNLSEDGKSLNVALDDGALNSKQTSVKYKAKITIKNGDNVIEEMESDEFDNKYWNELRNGSFETPEITSGYINEQYTNEEYVAAGGVWQSTGRGTNGSGKAVDIEIVNTRASFQDSYSWHAANDNDKAFDGNQFAELNCQNAGALYQDVMTYAGETMNYWLSHRARGEYVNNGTNTITGEKDTMYLVIMPTSTAMTAASGSELKTQDQLETYIKSLVSGLDLNAECTQPEEGNSNNNQGSEILYNNDGVLISRITSDDQSWHRIFKGNLYCSTSYLTRFFFMSGKTASGDKTVGNFLDEVGFSQDLPKASDGEFNLQVVKKFSGLSNPTDEMKKNITFTIKAYRENGTEEAIDAPLNNTSFALKDMEQTSDSVYTKSFPSTRIAGDKKYIYKVEETGSQVNTYTVETTQTISGSGEIQSDGKSVKIGEKDSVTFTITNTYTPIDINSVMEYHKTAQVDDWDKRTYDINITASSKLAGSSTTIEKDAAADIMMVLDTSGSMLYYGYGDYNDGYGFEYVYGNRASSRYYNVKSKLDTTKIYYYSNSTKNYNSRTNAKNPMIYLNDAWMYYDSGKWNLIKDTDSTVIYTIDSSLTGLKEASKAFIASTAAASSKCQIGLVTFASKDNSKLVKALSNARNNKDELIKSVSSIYAGGGTYVSKGLEKAAGQLKDKKDVPKYVILFTDGAANDESNAEKKAQELKANGITIYTVGFKLNTSTSRWLKDKIASEGCNFDANTTDGLKAIFQKIKDTITQSGDIGGAEITDVIDSRFELIEVGGTAITADQITKLKNKESVLINDATVSMTEDGNYQVKWSEQTIPEKGNWSKTIKVRAKDGYIGGNAVPTNVKDDSKIHTGYGDAVLPQPTVNVKSDLLVNNKEVKIFYGDTVPTDEDGDIVKALFDKAHPKGNVTQLDGTSKAVEYTMGANGEAINQQDFTLEWYRDSKCEEKDKITDWTQEKPTPDSTTYYLKVTYNALGNATKQSNANTTTVDGKSHGAGEGGKVTAHNSVTDQTRPYGVYTVYVIAGQIQITKELEEYPESTKEFKFEVTKEEDDTFKKELTISVDANSKVAEPQILDKLKRGTYHVREVLPEGSEYKVSSAEIGKATNCENVRPESSTYVATFKLGYKKDMTDKNVITAEYTYDDKNPSGTIGAVKYTNTEIKATLDLKKTDEKQNNPTYLDGAYFKLEKKSGENWGPVENYDRFSVGNKDTDIELNDLRNGDYRLTEVTAPSGYMLLSSPIYFTVSNGTVRLINEGTVSNMCELTSSTDSTQPPVLTIKNQKLYSLPESGGNGIYWYMIGGMVLMSTAAWILYKNKCREVLGK